MYYNLHYNIFMEEYIPEEHLQKTYWDLWPLVTLRGQIEIVADKRIHRQKDMMGFMGDTNAIQGEQTFQV